MTMENSKMQYVDCGCVLLALRTLARFEEIATSSQVPLETALDITFAVEQPSLAVLSCEQCRHQRLSLTTVTMLCTQLVDWLCRLWNLDDRVTATKSLSTTRTTPCPTVTATQITPLLTATTKTNNPVESQHTTQYHSEGGHQSWRFSLGDYDIAADEANAVGNELMTLRLTSLSGVLGSLEAALITYIPSHSVSSSTNVGVNRTVNNAADFMSGFLNLVQADLCRVRACIQQLKAESPM